MCFNGVMDNDTLTRPTKMVIHFDPLPIRKRVIKQPLRPETAPLLWDGSGRALRSVYRNLRKNHRMSPTSARCTIVRVVMAVTP